MKKPSAANAANLLTNAHVDAGIAGWSIGVDAVPADPGYRRLLDLPVTRNSGGARG